MLKNYGENIGESVGKRCKDTNFITDFTLDLVETLSKWEIQNIWFISIDLLVEKNECVQIHIYSKVLQC